MPRQGHARGWVACWGGGGVEACEERFVDMAKYLVEIDYSIHYHVWDLDAFKGFLAFLEREVPGYAMRVVGESGTLEEEFAFVLEKS